MAIKERMSGNEAVAYAIKQVNPDVMPAFPITPSTEIVPFISKNIVSSSNVLYSGITSFIGTPFLPSGMLLFLL